MSSSDLPLPPLSIFPAQSKGTEDAACTMTAGNDQIIATLIMDAGQDATVDRVDRNAAQDAAASALRQQSAAIVDNPCWGSPTRCSLHDLLQHVRKEDAILFENSNVIILNKPPDLRMDGPYPATVHKLLSYWYPSPSIRQRAKASSANAAASGMVCDTFSEALEHKPAAIAISGADSGSAPLSATNNSTSASELQNQHLEKSLLDTIVNNYHLHSDCRDCPLRPCHQLDYATSGVLLVARNKATAAAARKVWEERVAGLTKVYTAVLLGHVDIPNYRDKLTTEQEEQQHWPVLSAATLQSTLAEMEDSYRKARHAQSRPKTFEKGYVPVYSLFQRWNHQQDRLNPQVTDRDQEGPDSRRPIKLPSIPSESEPHAKRPHFKKVKVSSDAVGVSNASGDDSRNACRAKSESQSRGTNGAAELSTDEWDQVWAPVRQLTSQEYNTARTTKWKDLKKQQRQTKNASRIDLKANDHTHTTASGIAQPQEADVDTFAVAANVTSCFEQVISRFEQAASLYNQVLQERCGADATGATNDEGPHELALPALFCVKPDAATPSDSDDKNRSDAICKDTNLETFYISVPLAQVENEFAMRIHPLSRNEQRPVPQSESMKSETEPQYYDLPVGRAAHDNFKPSLTKCTIVQRTYLQYCPAEPLPSTDSSTPVDPRGFPVTLVEMQPLTGRRHQLRVHAAFAGHAIAGDCTYATIGKASDAVTEDSIPMQPCTDDQRRATLPTNPTEPTSWQSPHRSLVPRLCLHSTSLKVPGLLTGGDVEDLSVHSKIPFLLKHSDGKSGSVKDGHLEIKMF